MLHSRFFVTKTAGEFLFDGYKDPLLDLAQRMPAGTFPPFDKFGWLYTRNNSETYDGVFNIFTGVDRIDRFGEMDRWNYESQTRYATLKSLTSNLTSGKCLHWQWSLVQVLRLVLRHGERLFRRGLGTAEESLGNIHLRDGLLPDIHARLREGRGECGRAVVQVLRVGAHLFQRNGRQVSGQLVLLLERNLQSVGCGQRQPLPLQFARLCQFPALLPRRSLLR